MNKAQKYFLLLNLIFGSLVPISYVLGLQGQDPNLLWGGVPEDLRGLYTISMLLGALSFFIFSIYLLKLMEKDRELNVNNINLLYLMIHIPSALWIPLTNSMVGNPNWFTFLMIRLVLIVVGLSSLALLMFVIRTSPKTKTPLNKAAIIGLIWFTFHTAVLDAIIWPIFFLI